MINACTSRWMKITFAMVITILINITNALAQENGEPIIIGERHSFKSQILNDERDILIHLPRGYDNSDEKYPVLYALDGRSHFYHAASTMEYLSAVEFIPRLVIIAVTHKDRFQDSSPNKIDGESNSGGASDFQRFLGDELIPWVDANYRTQPFRILLGHSLTGMFAVYSLITQPNMFQAYVAASPHIGYYNDYIIGFAKEHIPKQVRWPKWLYITDAKEYGYTRRIQQFIKILKDKKVQDLEWDFVEMEDETHGSVVLKSLYDGLVFIFNDWKLPRNSADKSLTAIKEHFRKASDRLGYTTQIAQHQLNTLGYMALDKNDVKKAVALFQYNVELYPDSPNVYDSLGEAYERDGDLELAKQHYEKAYEMGRKTNSRNLFFYSDHLYRVKKKIELSEKKDD